MKNKGFTLAELLVVIVIIGLVTALAMPAVSNVISGRSKDTFEIQKKLIKEAANLYATKYKGKLLNTDASCIVVDYDTIKNAVNLKESEENFDCSATRVIFRKNANGSSFQYEYYMNCENKKTHLQFRFPENSPEVFTKPADCVEL